MQTFNYSQFLQRNGHIPDPQLPELNRLLNWLPAPTKDGPWVAGGSVRRMITDGVLGEGDIDFFFRDQQQFHNFCVAVRTDNRIKIIEEKVNENNIQYTIKMPGSLADVKVQAINFSFFENVEQLINQFDFTVCQFAYDGLTLYCGDYALWDLGRKRIVINNVRFPVATIRHLIKYSKQGFFACAGALTTLTSRIVQLGPSAINDKFKYID